MVGPDGDGRNGCAPRRSSSRSCRTQRTPRSRRSDQAGTFYPDKFPVQSFLWGDYASPPGTQYRFPSSRCTASPARSPPMPRTRSTSRSRPRRNGPTARPTACGSTAAPSPARSSAEEFGNKAPQNINDPADPEVQWLSRGLLEACLEYINETKPGDALRVAAYEFTYPPILDAFKALIDKGIDVQIVYHDTTDATGQPNETAMKAAGLPINDQKVTYRRSKTKIPHNKFIVRLRDGIDPVEVWTGSTNFTPSGFLGQTNVGHRIADVATAKQYFEFWKVVKTDPELADARARAMAADARPDRGDSGQVGRAGVLAASQGRDARLVRTAHAQRRELGVVHGGVRHHGEAGAPIATRSVIRCASC